MPSVVRFWKLCNALEPAGYNQIHPKVSHSTEPRASFGSQNGSQTRSLMLFIHSVLIKTSRKEIQKLK